MVNTSSDRRVAVVGGVRTPFARQWTELKDLSAVSLGKMVVAELIARFDLSPQDIEQLVFGQVVALPEAPNIAREIVLGNGLPDHIDAFSVSRACATSFQSVACIADAIRLGQIDVGIAGGADSSSVLPIGVSKKLAATLVGLSKAKSLGKKYQLLKKLRAKDLLPVPPAVKDYTTGLSMGASAEQMARDNQVSREAQDALAERSHRLAAQAWQENKLNSEVMTAFPPPYKQPFSKDNNIRENISLEKLASLRPAFDRKYGSVTAGNSTPLTDGAAAMLLMSEERAKALGYPILGFLRGYAFAALDARTNMLLGPSYATPKVLDNLGMSLSDMTLIDMHEAFAAQTLCNIDAFASRSFAEKALNRDTPIGEIDMDAFNVLGGSLAYGHPFAATGARMMTQTLNELKRRGGGLALTTACAAGGLGAAFVWEVEA